MNVAAKSTASSAAAARTASTSPTAAPREPIDTHGLLGQLGSEVAAALSAALEQVTVIATTGKISRQGLGELREQIERARRAGIMGQQVERLASGRVRQAPERVDLTAVLREALLQHRRQAVALGIALRPALAPAQVMADPALIVTFIETLLSWTFEHARSAVELRIELGGWPVRAGLACSFRHLSDEDVDRSLLVFGGSPLYTIAWRLLQQAARTMELPLELTDDGVSARLLIEFPRTVNDPSEAAALRDRSGAEQSGVNSKPLAGCHLLVVAARRETRALVREAVRHMGLMLDYVNSVDEARQFCNGGMPHAILHESALGGDRFERLRLDLLSEVPKLVFIELAEEGRGVQTRRIGARQFSSIGRGTLVESLPPTLMYELSRPR